MLTNITHNDDEEMLLCFDECGNVIKSSPRSIVHQKPYKIWHAIVNTWILNNNGAILCTRRAPHVSGNPGKWQTYVGGHVKAGSTFYETVVRELFEEIGLRVKRNDLKLVEKGKRRDVMHVYESYATLFNQDLSIINFSDGEVSDARWLSFEDYQNSKNKNPDEWCNGISLDQYKKVCAALGL
ncbi:NUDIX domain-containing protein [Candidatus Poribacteria bacterium]|nr:NUDIX domain-containing protein [Candidatus Poribacteria bacterium]